MKKTAVLMENFRRAIGLRIKETKEVYEGEVTELTPCETESAMGGYGKTVNHVIIGLKTAKGNKQLKVYINIHVTINYCMTRNILSILNVQNMILKHG